MHHNKQIKAALHPLLLDYPRENTDLAKSYIHLINVAQQMIILLYYITKTLINLIYRSSNGTTKSLMIDFSVLALLNIYKP